jgi:mRNA interferase HigB
MYNCLKEIFNHRMRLLAPKTIKHWCTQFPEAKGALEAWALRIRRYEWNNSQEVRKAYCKASIINQQRVVFNIKGNTYRLIVDID